MMKKKIAVLLVFICLAAALEPTVSYARVTPVFVAVNDTILPFTDDNMPYLEGGMIFMPVTVFSSLRIYSKGSADDERVVLYTGVGTAMRFLEFSTRPGNTSVKDQDNNILNWPAARRVGRRFYVPLRQVCEFFGLSHNACEIGTDIIPQQQMSLVRIVSNASFSIETLVNINRNALRTAYNNYYAPTITPSPPAPPGGIDEPPPVEEPPPVYSDVSVFLSFYDIAAGSVDSVLDMLGAHTASGYHTCFFVSADDVLSDPGLIRRISGAGHTIGIRLRDGTLEEFDRTSGLLFEATKIRTVLVSVIGDDIGEEAQGEEAGNEATPGDGSLDSSGLIIWRSSQSFGFADDMSESDITDMIPTETGERYSLMFPCSENATRILRDVLTFLREYEYTLEKITETMSPIFPL